MLGPQPSHGPSASPGQSTPSGPTTTIFLQLCLLTCWPHSLVLGSVLHPSPPWACLQCRMSLGTRKVPLKRGWVRRSLSPLAPPLMPYPGKAKLSKAAPDPPSPLFQAPSLNTLPGFSPKSLPSGGTGALVLPDQPFTLSPSPSSAPSLLPECTATLSTLDPTHTSGPSTEGPSEESPGSPATSAQPGTSPGCYMLQGTFMPHGKSSWLTYSFGFFN